MQGIDRCTTPTPPKPAQPLAYSQEVRSLNFRIGHEGTEIISFSIGKNKPSLSFSLISAACLFRAEPTLLLLSNFDGVFIQVILRAFSL
jgi:hypothetical protein